MATLPTSLRTPLVMTLLVFAVFAVAYMKARLTLNHLWAGLCLLGAVFFSFRGQG